MRRAVALRCFQAFAGLNASTAAQTALVSAAAFLRSQNSAALDTRLALNVAGRGRLALLGVHRRTVLRAGVAVLAAVRSDAALRRTERLAVLGAGAGMQMTVVCCTAFRG